MAAAADQSLHLLVKDKVEEELQNLSLSREGRETREMSKTAKEVAGALLPELANIISVAVTTAVTSAVREVAKELLHHNKVTPRACLTNKYEIDKLEQYMRRDNIRISGIKEEEGETEDILEAKVLGLANNLGVELESRDISVAHRLGKPTEGNKDRPRPVIVRLCQRKKKTQIMKKKKEMKTWKDVIYMNEDLTPLRVALLKIVKEHDDVKSVTTIDGKILAWYKNRERPLVIHTPDDLYKVGITLPDWKLLKLDHLATVADDE